MGLSAATAVVKQVVEVVTGQWCATALKASNVIRDGISSKISVVVRRLTRSRYSPSTSAFDRTSLVPMRRSGDQFLAWKFTLWGVAGGRIAPCLNTCCSCSAVNERIVAYLLNFTPANLVPPMVPGFHPAQFSRTNLTINDTLTSRTFELALIIFFTFASSISERGRFVVLGVCVCVCVCVCVFVRRAATAHAAMPSRDCRRVTLVSAAKVIRCIWF